MSSLKSRGTSMRGRYEFFTATHLRTNTKRDNEREREGERYSVKKSNFRVIIRRDIALENTLSRTSWTREDLWVFPPVICSLRGFQSPRRCVCYTMLFRDHDDDVRRDKREARELIAKIGRALVRSRRCNLYYELVQKNSRSRQELFHSYYESDNFPLGRSRESPMQVLSAVLFSSRIWNPASVDRKREENILSLF